MFSRSTFQAPKKGKESIGHAMNSKWDPSHSKRMGILGFY